MHSLTVETIIHKPIEEVFDFFSKAENLNKLTPPELYFKIITPLPITMKVGTLIDYQLKLTGIPFKWKTKITKWDPPFVFEDTQLKGPYNTWIHEHRFESVGNGTKMTDYLQYRSPGGFLEFIPHHLFVKAKVEEIFRYRNEILLKLMS